MNHPAACCSACRVADAEAAVGPALRQEAIQLLQVVLGALEAKREDLRNAAVSLDYMREALAYRAYQLLRWVGMVGGICRNLAQVLAV
jgi:hypothetical protein